jgi:site-specific DNA-cytosine methylase
VQGVIRIVSLFSGGGFAEEALRLASERTGIATEVVMAVDSWDPAARVRDANLGGVRTTVRSVKEMTRADLPPHDLVIGGPPCFTGDTMVLTITGYKPICDLSAGEIVLTHKGRWRKITSIMRRENVAIVKVRGNGIPDIRTTADHPFYARLKYDTWSNADRMYSRAFLYPEWTEASDLTSKHFLGQVLPPQVSDDHHSIAFWWLVGRYLADGWRIERANRPSGRIRICGNKKEATELRERIKAAGLNPTELTDKAACRFEISDAKTWRFLEQFGHLAHGKTLPGWCLGLDAARATALLEGYGTGDGYRDKRHSCTRITTVSKSLALGMALLSQRVKGTVAGIALAKVKTTKQIDGRTVNQRPWYRVDVRDSNRSSFVEFAYGWKRVTSIADDGVDTVFNISVEEDESYCADGAIVHNCQDHSLAGKRACSCNVGGPVAERCCLADFMRLAGGSAWLMENVRPRLIRDGWSEQFCAADFGDVTSRKRWFYSSHLLHVFKTPGPRRFGDIRDHDADAKAIDKRGRYDPRRFGAKFGIGDGEIPGSVCGNTHLGGGGTLVEIRPGAGARIAADDDAILGSVTADSWHGTKMGGTSMVAMRSYPQPYTERLEDGVLGSVTSHTHDQPLRAGQAKPTQADDVLGSLTAGKCGSTGFLKVGLRGHSASAFEDDEVLGSVVSNSWHGNELGKLGPSVRCPSLLEMARAHSIPDSWDWAGVTKTQRGQIIANGWPIGMGTALCEAMLRAIDAALLPTCR